MKCFLALYFLVAIGPSLCLANQLAECHGTNIWDHDVVAKVFYIAGVGSIVMQDNVDTIESKTTIEGAETNTLKVFDNDFVMNFSVTSGQKTSPV